MTRTGADAIVIGAGAIGCSAAWHLRQAGAEVVVVEAAPGPAAGSTGAAAGFVASWSALHVPAWGAVEWAMQQFGIAFYRRLAEEHPPADWLAPHGIAYVFLDPERWHAAQAGIEALRRLGSPVAALAAAEAARLLPPIRFDAVAGIAYDPSAIRVRAGEAIRCLAAAGAAAGARFTFGERVLELLTKDGAVRSVRTDSGPIEAKTVIVAAGAWSRPLLAQLGVACPAEPLVETRFVTAPLPEIPPDLPLLIFSDRHGFYIREERGGLLIGGGDDDPLPADRFVDPDAPPAPADLPPDQAHRLRGHLREIEAALPALRGVAIAEIRSGLPTFTADRRFIADAVPGRDGLLVATACQEAGVTHGPAIGRQLADLAMGEPPLWDRGRFRFPQTTARKETA
jgi:glycine/D-amino acid oxidase-like deaminating enzyme